MNGGEIFVKDKIFVEVGSGGQFLPLINFSTFWTLLHLPELPLLPHYWFVLIHLVPSAQSKVSSINCSKNEKNVFFSNENSHTFSRTVVHWASGLWRVLPALTMFYLLRGCQQPLLLSLFRTGAAVNINIARWQSVTCAASRYSVREHSNA